jgi:flagellar protein FlbD
VIQLKRLNGTAFYLNAELIEQIDSAPDTVITLVTGNNIVVREPAQDVIEKIISYRRSVNAEREGQKVQV